MKKLLDKLSKTSIIALLLIMTTLKGDVTFSKTNEGVPVSIVKVEESQEESTLTKAQDDVMILEEHLPTGIPSEREMIERYIDEICCKYNMEPELIRSIIYQESRFIPNVSNGQCVGLMQVSRYWHAKRALKLGVTDFYDPYSNILLGVDYLSELINTYKDKRLAIMLYSMDNNVAFDMYRKGQIHSYTTLVINKSKDFKKGE